jgi:hypothetical protein
MKTLRLWLFLLFLLLAGSYAVMQSGFGKNFIRAIFANALQNSGFFVTIDHIEGTLPHQIELKGVALTGNQVSLTAEQISLRPVLWRLLKKEIAFTQVHARGVSIDQGTPFDFEGKFRMSQNRAFLRGQIADWTLTARLHLQSKKLAFTAANPLVATKGEVQLDAAYHPLTAQVELESEQLLAKLPFDAQGRLLAHLLIERQEENYQIRATWQIPLLVVKETDVGKVLGTGTGTWGNRILQAEITADPFAKATFDWEILPDFRLVGSNTVTIENLQSFRIPHVFGKCEAKADWSVSDNLQKLSLDVTSTNFYYGPFFAQKASLYSDLEDPLHTWKGLVDIEFEKARWRELELESASFEATGEKENWNFRLFAEGEWKHPLEIHMNGSWKNHFTAQIENLDGTFFNHPFLLSKPISFEWTEDIFRLSPAEISIAGASALLQIDRQGDRTDARLRCSGLPLDFLSLNPLDVSVAGLLNLEADVHEERNRLQGDLKASIEGMEVASLGDQEKLNAAGRFTGHFDKDLLALKGDLHVRSAPLLHLDVSLPIHFSLWPFEADLLLHKAAKGNIALNGRIEDFLDFVDLGPHRLEGACLCDLKFTNTLYRPLVAGVLQFENGSYENYYTGTQLQNIRADFLAEKNTLYLRSFQAQDAKSGTLTATGEISLKQGDLYPFHLDVAFNQLQFAEIDLVSAAANGNVHIEGNATSALAQGDVHILQCAFTIPDHIPRPLPNLQVVYLNPIHPPPPPETAYQPYPLHLDLRVFAPQSVTIAGRGLSSEWKGDFQLTGTYTAPAAKGKLELIDGEFNFSSRSFKLTEGSLSLSGVEHEMPHLNLAAATETHGVSILARLKGPLDDPQITLQSVPPLPLGSIMSYLLFGQDLSEISGFQAIQIASSLASLAGTGPDIMESTRRSLGVDRLRVISEPTEEGGETVALQVGKYVSKGVLVTFSQSASDSGPEISVEVELKGNFVFQVQNDQRQEQGIFTLKWSRNY